MSDQLFPEDKKNWSPWLTKWNKRVGRRGARQAKAVLAVVRERKDKE